MRIQAGFLIGLVFCLLSHGVLTGISYQLGPKSVTAADYVAML